MAASRCGTSCAGSNIMTTNTPKKRATKTAAPSPTEPRRKPFTPEWAQRKGYDGQVSTSYVRPRDVVEGLQEGRFRLPRFQRPYVWTDEQVLVLLDSIRRGYHFGELLLWQRYNMPATVEQFNDVRLECPALSGIHRALIVVDGQQRIGALATAALSGRFYLNLLDGSVAIGVTKEWHVPMGLVFGGRFTEFWAWCERHCSEYNLESHNVMDAYASAVDAFNTTRVGYVELPEEWSLDRVLESYRRLNTCGTPMDHEHLAEGLRRASSDETSHGN